MQVAGASYGSGYESTVVREVSAPRAAPVQSAPREVKLVALTDTYTASALDELPPTDPAPVRAARATQAWLNHSTDPLDEYVDGCPGLPHPPRPAPSQRMTTLGEGVFA